MTVGLYAWTTTADGETSLVGALVGDLHMPLIATTWETANLMRPLALMHATASGQTVYLQRFEFAETLETLGRAANAR